jgi:hypothetical protein
MESENKILIRELGCPKSRYEDNIRTYIREMGGKL